MVDVVTTAQAQGGMPGGENRPSGGDAGMDLNMFVAMQTTPGVVAAPLTNGIN